MLVLYMLDRPCLTNKIASTHMVKPMKASNTCQALGRANKGASQRAPNPNNPNQNRLAKLAPATLSDTSTPMKDIAAQAAA